MGGGLILLEKKPLPSSSSRGSRGGVGRDKGRRTRAPCFSGWVSYGEVLARIPTTGSPRVTPVRQPVPWVLAEWDRGLRAGRGRPHSRTRDGPEPVLSQGHEAGARGRGQRWGHRTPVQGTESCSSRRVFYCSLCDSTPSSERWDTRPGLLPAFKGCCVE